LYVRIVRLDLLKKLCPRVTARGQNPEHVLQPKLIRGLAAEIVLGA
jgi:hypothetical protein